MYVKMKDGCDDKCMLPEFLNKEYKKTCSHCVYALVHLYTRDDLSHQPGSISCQIIQRMRTSTAYLSNESKASRGVAYSWVQS